MRTGLYFLFFLFAGTFAQGQSIGVQAGGGYGIYLMSALKAYQQDLMRSVEPLPVIETDKLGSGPFTDLQFQWSVKKFTGSVCYRRLTTGGRLAYSDYSGSMEFRQEVIANSYGIAVAEKAIVKPKWEIQYGLEIYFVNDTYKYSSYSVVNGASPVYVSGVATSESWMFNPFLEAAAIMGDFRLSFKGGYSYNTFHTKLDIDWTGARFGLYGTYTFRSAKR